jgi:hypothetical protein
LNKVSLNEVAEQAAHPAINYNRSKPLLYSPGATNRSLAKYGNFPGFGVFGGKCMKKEKITGKNFS